MNTNAVAPAANLWRRQLCDPGMRKLGKIAPPIFFELALGIGVALMGTALVACISAAVCEDIAAAGAASPRTGRNAVTSLVTLFINNLIKRISINV